MKYGADDQSKLRSAPGHIVDWDLLHKDGTHGVGTGQTAFVAARSIGWNLWDLQQPPVPRTR